MTANFAQEPLQRLIFGLSAIERLGKTIIAGQGRFSASSDAYLRLILDAFGVHEGAILLFNPVESQLTVDSAINIGDESLVIPLSPDAISALLKTPIVELASPPPALKPLLARIQPQLQRSGAHIWATLSIEREFLGVISLGASAAADEAPVVSRMLLQTAADHISAVIAYSRSLDEMRRAKLRLFLLSDTTAQIAKLLDTEQLGEQVVNHSVSLLDASTGCLMLIDPFTRQLEMKRGFTLDNPISPALKKLSIPLKANQTMHPAFSILQEVAATGKTRICNDEKISSAFGVKNFMAAPVFGREILGALVVCGKEGRKSATPDFTHDDGILLEAFATQAAIALENARLYQEALEKRRLQSEMEEAAKVQRNLLPEKPPEIPGYDVAGLSVPRSDGVGGDYFGYIPCPDGSWGFAILDVSGKGMQAALLMATLRAGLRSEVARQMDLPAMAITLNSLIYESSIPDRYATLFYARLQPEKGILTSINAGHTFPIIARRAGAVERLEKGGVVLGMYPYDMLCKMAQYEEEVAQLYSGDVVLFFTDGVTETLNSAGEAYEEERLEALMKQLRRAGAREICEAVYQSVLEFKGEAPQFDDLTLMALKKK